MQQGADGMDSSIIKQCETTYVRPLHSGTYGSHTRSVYIGTYGSHTRSVHSVLCILCVEGLYCAIRDPR
jgi:hypothetical protein